jgi:hypothetical protein
VRKILRRGRKSGQNVIFLFATQVFYVKSLRRGGLGLYFDVGKFGWRLLEAVWCREMHSVDLHVALAGHFEDSFAGFHSLGVIHIEARAELRVDTLQGHAVHNVAGYQYIPYLIDGMAWCVAICLYRLDSARKRLVRREGLDFFAISLSQGTH